MHDLGNNFIHEKRSLLDYVHLLRDNYLFKAFPWFWEFTSLAILI